MKRFIIINVFCLVHLLLSFSLFLGTNTAFAAEEEIDEKFKNLQSRIEALCEPPFEGTAEEFPVYTKQIGSEILSLVDPLLKEELSNPVSGESEKSEILFKGKLLGLLLQYGFDDAEYEKEYEKFFKESQGRFSRWANSRFTKPDQDSNGESTEKYGKYAPLIRFQRKFSSGVLPEEIYLTTNRLILASDDLTLEQRAPLQFSQFLALQKKAEKAIQKNPHLRPEIAYKEMEEVADELLKTEFLNSYKVHLFSGKLKIAVKMADFMRKNMESGHVEYAEEIMRRVLEFAQRFPEDFSQMQGSLFFVSIFEWVDTIHATSLARTFLEQMFATEGNKPKVHLERILKRLSSPGQKIEFETILLDGSKINVNELHGKVVLIYFWDTGCPPCLEALPFLRNLHEKYAPHGYEMLAYSCDTDLELLAKFVEKRNDPWKVGSRVMSTEKGLTNYYKFYGVMGKPQVIILDRDGVVQLVMTGVYEKRLAEELEKIFADVPAK